MIVFNIAQAGEIDFAGFIVDDKAPEPGITRTRAVLSLRRPMPS